MASRQRELLPKDIGLTKAIPEKLERERKNLGAADDVPSDRPWEGLPSGVPEGYTRGHRDPAPRDF